MDRLEALNKYRSVLSSVIDSDMKPASKTEKTYLNTRYGAVKRAKTSRGSKVTNDLVSRKHMGETIIKMSKSNASVVANKKIR